ncbi:hypothetical protein GNP88_18380 [Aliivibrio fischeri]|uniref:Uncharacterized protein n=2 Tax=Aliivibrio fischeri TaxID=668 RepID=A0A844P6U7_ALIFS|nr:hypothetical protein [Aliivibrio fischeri]
MVMRMTPSEIREAALNISLMREGHKPRTERIDREAKQRIDDKWYQLQLRKINEDALM